MKSIHPGFWFWMDIGVRKKGQLMTLPDIFRDANYGASKTWHLSTSNLSNDLFDSWGWGEVVPDGLGIAYSTNSDCIRFTVTSGRGFTRGFCQQLETALQDMVRVFLQPSSKL